MSDFKSISPVNTSNGWAVCQTNNDGTQLFILPEVYEPRFSEARAETEADMLKHHIELGGRTYAKPLPAGVKLLT